MKRAWILPALLAGLGAGAQEAAPDREGVEFFEQKIRPVLVDQCHSCHSAGAKSLKGELHLDSRAGILKGGETGPAVVPGNLEKSLLITSVRWTDDDLKMPPKKRLPKAAVEDLEAWVRRGAPMPADAAGAVLAKKKAIDYDKARDSWAFRPPTAPAVPAVKDAAWVRGPIDAFVLARLEAAGVKPAPALDRRRLLRRATFGLTGLPPTPEETEAFVADPAPDAYEKAVDRLLASPAYGERWARLWLDVARFAESHGFEQDYDRENAWWYRDFLIQAFNRDLPFDEFCRWQVAGDELGPGEPLAWMATGFLGAGAFPTQLTEVEFEPARYDELDSMVSTIGSAMLGVTVGCARCHDHKFDPFSVQDYYRLAAAFATAIRSMAELPLDPEGDRKALEIWTAERGRRAAAWAAFERERGEDRFRAWKASKPWERDVADWVLVDAPPVSVHKTVFKALPDGSFLATGENPSSERWTMTAKGPFKGLTAIRIEALSDPSLKKGGPGRADNGNFALSALTVKAGGAAVPLRFAGATFEQNASSLSGASALDGNPASGWAVDPQFGKDHAALYRFETPLDADVLTIEAEFTTNVRHSIGRPRVSLSNAAAPDLRGRVQTGIWEALRRGTADEAQTRAAWRESDPEAAALFKALADHDAAKPGPKLTKILVTTEGLKPLKHHADERGFPHYYPQVHVLARGDVNKKQGVAEPGFPKALTRTEDAKWIGPPPPPGSKSSRRRSGVARWLTDPSEGAGGLLARVIVNRLWAAHFGRGIVATVNDFGAQGEAATHPELLDHLAAELVRDGWSLKRAQRRMLLSAAYRVGSEQDEASAKKDPDNRLFGRRAPRRLEAEAIRDGLLAVSGLLDRRLYGAGTLDEGMTRRSLYFFIKRSRLIPMLQVFDAPEPLVSIGTRPTTTIAPQALLFMNSPHVRRWAAALGKRLDEKDPVGSAYRMALGRVPLAEEREAGSAFLAAQERSYQETGAADAAERARTDFAHAVVCLNEFVYVD
jgi:hypothetical protein